MNMAKEMVRQAECERLSEQYCQRCENLQTVDGKCSVSSALRCFYNEDKWGWQLAENPPLLGFKEKREVAPDVQH